jgi:hypothetical protein
MQAFAGVSKGSSIFRTFARPAEMIRIEIDVFITHLPMFEKFSSSA